jgi:hypothetical protein
VRSFPGFPIVFSATIFDADDRIFAGELNVEIDELFAGQFLAGALLENVILAIVEFGRGNIEREEDLLARFVTGVLGGLKITSIAASALSSFGAKPPSSPTAVERPFFFSTDLRAWKISVMACKPSEKVSKPFGMIMNSWKSIGASECAPPLMTFAIGTGNTFAFGPPRYLNSGKPIASEAAFRGGERNGENCVCAELALGFGAIEFEHGAIDCQLIEGVLPFQDRKDRFDHIANGL